MRIAIIADVHANLPALKAVLSVIDMKGYDKIVHLGDAISIGPFSKECLEILLGLESVQLIMGNHDDWCANGLPNPRPNWMSDGEIEHQLWTHARLGDQHRAAINSWPFFIEKTLHDLRLLFTRYALAEDSRSFMPFRFDPTAVELDLLFGAVHADLIFFGHDHETADIFGVSHYVNLGSVGCQKTAFAPYCILELSTKGYHVSHHLVHYDDLEVSRTFQSRCVPARDFIIETFFGGRYLTE